MQCNCSAIDAMQCNTQPRFECLFVFKNSIRGRAVAAHPRNTLVSETRVFRGWAATLGRADLAALGVDARATLSFALFRVYPVYHKFSF